MSLVLESADARDFRLSLKNIANLLELAVVQYKWDPSDSASNQKKGCVTCTALLCVVDVETYACWHVDTSVPVCTCRANYFLHHDHDFVMHVHGFVG
jgi:hypothetical protein